ncbi:MAG: hypothetical protein MUP90_12310, partial [Gammaproteobacteria bacterium]|nr:hypothetical protein [Gammaproteobacteria bacterium]
AVAGLRETLARQSQSSPSITGKAAALVALAKDSRLDGRIGVGDVVVSIMLAGGGSTIGLFGAAAIQFGNLDLLSTGECYGLCALSGCALGMGRMAIDALAVPMMMSNGLDWLAERWQEWLDHQKEIAALPTKATERPVPFYTYGEEEPAMPWETYTADYADLPITIREETDTLEAVNWTYGQLWYFIEDCFFTGEWSRRKAVARWKQHFGPESMSQDLHKIVFDFLQAKTPGLWDLKGQRNRPTLEAYLRRFRWSPASQPASQPANQE